VSNKKSNTEKKLVVSVDQNQNLKMKAHDAIISHKKFWYEHFRFSNNLFTQATPTEYIKRPHLFRKPENSKTTREEKKTTKFRFQVSQVFLANRLALMIKPQTKEASLTGSRLISTLISHSIIVVGFYIFIRISSFFFRQ
jgi:hypothetical protein